MTPLATVGLVTDIATIIIAVALVVTVVALAVIALYAKRAAAKVGDLLEKVQEGVDPVMKHARDVGDNVNYITTSIRVDVEQINRTVAAANQRVNDAMAQAEKRISSLNALLEVVQDEAEDIFVSTASTVRGVRAAARTLREPRRPPVTDGGDEPL